MNDYQFKRDQLVLLNLKEFIRALTDFKTVYKSREHFENNLSILHRTFIKLRNIFRNKNYLGKPCTEKSGDFITYRIGNITLLKHNIHGFISVDSGNTEINQFLILKRNTNLLFECKMFANFETLVCDFCGKIGEDIPKNKFLDDIYVLSFHDRCLEILKDS